MICSDVTLSVGKSLSFNDLPSHIKITLTLKNARNLGAQEIFNRFNTGKGRSYVRWQQSYVETSDNACQFMIIQIRKIFFIQDKFKWK
jgi:hypothetical protein